MKLPRDLSGEEVARLLGRHYGYRVSRTRGSHMTVTRTSGSERHSVTVPRHRQMLNHLAAGPEALTFVSLFDDTADVWANEDFRLVEPLSTVSRWSWPDEFAVVLSEAA